MPYEPGVRKGDDGYGSRWPGRYVGRPNIRASKCAAEYLKSRDGILRIAFQHLPKPSLTQMDIDCNLGQDRSWYPSGREKTITVD